MGRWTALWLAALLAAARGQEDVGEGEEVQGNITEVVEEVDCKLKLFCDDNTTEICWEQFCDGKSDCPKFEGGEGGDDEFYGETDGSGYEEEGEGGSGCERPDKPTEPTEPTDVYEESTTDRPLPNTTTVAAVDECWDPELGHPDVRGDDPTWSHCPDANPATWRREDVAVTLDCQADSATLNYDLSLMDTVGWLDGVAVTVTLEEGIIIRSTASVANFTQTEEHLDLFCPGSNYTICLKFNPGGSDSNEFCEDCSTEPGPPLGNPAGLVATGVAPTLNLQWQPLEPECPNTRYEILVDREVVAETADTEKWLTYEIVPEGEEGSNNTDTEKWVAGVHEVAVRAINDEGPSGAVPVVVLHVVQALAPPEDLAVDYKVEEGVLMATITWQNSMAFANTDPTNRGYYINLYNKPSEASRPEGIKHDGILNMTHNSYNVNFTDTMDWKMEYSLQTFYDEDSSNETERVGVFSEQIELAPPTGCITNYETDENGTVSAQVKVWHQTDYVFDGLKVVLSLWAGNGTELLGEPEEQESAEFEIPLAAADKNTRFSVRTIVGGSSSVESSKGKLLNNLCFGYVNGWYILPYIVALVALLILILLAILYCICKGCCCRPLPDPKKSPKSAETKVLINDANDGNGYQGGGPGAEARLPLLPSQTPTAFKKEPPTPDGRVTTPLSMKKRFLFSKSRDSIINMSEPGWMWRKNIESDMF